MSDTKDCPTCGHGWSDVKPGDVGVLIYDGTTGQEHYLRGPMTPEDLERVMAAIRAAKPKP